ncbi:MAG: hypothetical protein N2C14_02810, partial [Planctomycetales bacterium]
MKTVKTTCITAEMFGDFSHEFHDEAMSSRHASPLGNSARHKGQGIERTLRRVSEITGRLLETDLWKCWWSGLEFHLESMQSGTDPLKEFRAVAGTSAEWFHVNGTGDEDGPELAPRSYPWGPAPTLGLQDPLESAPPIYTVQAVVEINVLSEFEVEMELLGVAQRGSPYVSR